MKRIILFVVAALLFVGAQSLYAQCEKGKACCAKDKQKAALTQLKNVTKSELTSLLETKNVIVVDARDADSYSAGHIDGALSFVNDKLPTDKNAALVFYCGGMKCPAAQAAAKKAIQKGYKNVMVFRGGWAEWSSNS
jgi:rhodanese-related sulfurtransferase